MASGPKFYFTIEDIVVIYPDSTTHLLPPEQPTSHARVPGSERGFKFDGHATTPCNISDVRRLKLYKASTIYYIAGRFWIAPQDASDPDGEDLSNGEEPDPNDGTSSEEPPIIPWRDLSFRRWPEDVQNVVSHASGRHAQNNLVNQHPDQVWPHELLPAGYHMLRDPDLPDFRPGALVGELAILIGLIAMSLAPQFIPRFLPPAIAHPPDSMTRWTVDPGQFGFARTGWQQGRGLFIKILYKESETTREALDHYEEGRSGPLFYMP